MVASLPVKGVAPGSSVERRSSMSPASGQGLQLLFVLNPVVHGNV